jgi:hypothetical protein
MVGGGDGTERKGGGGMDEKGVGGEWMDDIERKKY